MPAPYHTEKDVRALAERLDHYFLGYYLDGLMEEGKRSGLEIGKGTRAQTFRRRFLFYMLRVTFECDEVLVERALKKDRSSIREGVDEFKALLIYNTWGLGIGRFCERAYETEQDYLQLYVVSDEKPDPEFLGWRRSLAAFAFFCATKAWLLDDAECGCEHLTAAEIREIADSDNVIQLAKRPAKSYKTISSENRAKEKAAAEKTKQITLSEPRIPNAYANLKPSHPAIALIERNRHLFKQLTPMACSDIAVSGDYFTLVHVEADLIKGKGERIRIRSKAGKDALKAALPAMLTALNAHGYKASVQLAPEACAARSHGAFALVRI